MQAWASDAAVPNIWLLPLKMESENCSLERETYMSDLSSRDAREITNLERHGDQ
jgi:hypothetical protein